MPDWFDALPSGFMPHGVCLRWDKPLLFLIVVSNIGIAIAYFAIPLALRRFVGERKDLPYPHMFKLFAAFILSCGITHLAKVFTLYYPAYWGEAVIDAWTAVISLATAVLLYPLIPKALALRSPQALDEVIEKLGQANRELAAVNDELAVVNLNLQVARDQALEASMIKSAFIANVSHELRTPLSAVLGMNEVLLSTSLDNTQKLMAETVQDSAQSLLLLVNDILDLSKIEAGKLHIESVPLSLAEVVADALVVLQLMASAKNVALNLDLADDLPTTVLGDPTRMRQILVNLVGNAIKFTHEGSVTVSASVQSRDADQVQVEFKVKDTGIGITEEQGEMLFLPFTQADMSTTRKYGGTGLGLAISKKLVDLLNGQIGFTSEKGRGSTFWFLLSFKCFDPVKCSVPEALNVPVPVELGTNKAVHSIMVVEDNRVMQAVVAEQLNRLGFTFLLCDSAEKALEEFGEREYCLVLMDCHLPNMDGFAATRAIRAQEKSLERHVPIVAMTAATLKGDREKCLAAGMDDYLAKPYSLGQLEEILQKWIPQKARTSGDENPEPATT